MNRLHTKAPPRAKNIRKQSREVCAAIKSYLIPGTDQQAARRHDMRREGKQARRTNQAGRKDCPREVRAENDGSLTRRCPGESLRLRCPLYDALCHGVRSKTGGRDVICLRDHVSLFIYTYRRERHFLERTGRSFRYLSSFQEFMWCTEERTIPCEGS